jgi:hypothetical protein
MKPCYNDYFQTEKVKRGKLGSWEIKKLGKGVALRAFSQSAFGAPYFPNFLTS